MKYGTLLYLDRPENAQTRFSYLCELGMNACQLVYKPEVYTTEAAKTIREAADDVGIDIMAQFCGFRDSFISWDMQYDFRNAGINSPQYGAARMSYLLSAIPFLGEIGVTDMIIHPGFIPNDPYSEQYALMVSAVGLLSNRLKRVGCNLLFETGGESPISLLRLICDVGNDNLFVNMDTGNLIMYGFGNPVDALTTYGSYVRSLHIKDGLPPTIPGKIGPEVAVGNGNVDFPKVIALLKKLHYDRCFIFEREISGEKQRTDLLAAYSYIRGLWEQNNRE